jgi:hypothetical protein
MRTFTKRSLARMTLGWLGWIALCQGLYELVPRYTHLSAREVLWMLLAFSSFLMAVESWRNSRGLIRAHEGMMRAIVGLTHEHLEAAKIYDAQVRLLLPDEVSLIGGGATRTVNSIVEMMKELDAEIPPREFAERMTTRLRAIAYGDDNPPPPDAARPQYHTH